MSWEDFAEGFASGFVPAYNARIEREARRAATKEDREYAAQVREEELEAQRELFEWQITRENQLEQSAKDREYGAITDSVMTQYDLPDAVRPQVFASVRATGSAEGFIERYEDGDISLSGSAPKTFAPEELGSMLNKVNSQFNLPEGYLYTTAGIESSYNPKAENQNSSAGGLFQQMDANAQQYGVTNRFDPVESTLGAAKFALDNAETLRGILGRNPNGAELYLAHQQGAGGASALLSDPNANVLDVMTRVYGGHRAKAKKAVQNNGGDLSMTAGEFANLWIDKYNSRASVFMPDEEARPSGPAPDGFGLNASTDSEMSDLFTGASGLSFNEENEEPVDQFGMMSADSLDMGRSIDRTAQLPSVETPDTRSLEFGAGSSYDFSFTDITRENAQGYVADALAAGDQRSAEAIRRYAETLPGDQDDWRDISTVREGNWRSIVAKAEEAGDVDYAERVRALGEQFDEGEYSLSDQTYVITYQDDNGQTRRVTAPVDENTGRFIDLSTGNAIERDRLVGDAVPSENVSGFLKEYARISTRIEPFQEQRGALLDTMRSAEALENIVLENDDILTSIGGSGAKLIEGLKQEFEAMSALVSSGANEQEISAEIDRIASKNSSVLSGVSDQAQLATLFNAQVLRFAFNYAKTGLGQEGVGLSNKDFENALNIVSSGSSYDTFSQNLRDRVRESASSVENRRLELSEDPAVRAVLTMPSAEQWTSDLLSRPTEEFVESRGLSDVYQWSQGTPQDAELPQGDTTQAPEAQPNASGSLIEQYQNGRPITVTEELADRFPSLQGQVGKTIQRRGEQ